MRFILPLAAAVCIAFPALAATSKLDPLVRRGLQQVRAGATLESLQESGVQVSSARELDVFIAGSASRAALEAAGARIRTELPGVVTAYVPAEAIDRVAALADVTSIQGAVRLEPVLDTSVPATAAHLLRGPGPTFTGLNGAGVIVGVVDTGVDFDHGDFENPDGTTRLLNIWDQTVPGSLPAGFGYGFEWTAAQINAGDCTEIDDEFHGTHVLGIAGGDGSATGGSIPAFTYVGMAPRADLVMVKTDFNTTHVVDGVAYVMNRAAALGKHAVVNLSLGTLYGPKDGTSGFEVGLDALTGPGRIVVCAAGNSRGRQAHAEAIAPPSGSASITLSCGTANNAAVRIDGYYEAGGTVSMTLQAPGGATYGPVTLGARNANYPGTLTSSGRIYFENGYSFTATGDRQIEIELSVPNGSGTNIGGLWTITFTNASASVPVEVDLWIYSRNVTALFAQGEQPAEELVIEPANAAQVISVAGHFTKDHWTDCGGRLYSYGPPWQVGMLAGFSSPGPTRDGRQKPDLSAGALGVGSALSHDVALTCPSPGPDILLDDGLQHYINEGTSMSAPHVAGAVALLLQKYGAMTPAQVKSFLFSRALTDGFTGATWNKDWGHGKLFLGDLTDPSALMQDPNGGESFIIGTERSLEWTASDPYAGVTAVDLHVSRSDGGPFEAIALGVPNTGSYAWAVSGPVTNTARLRVTAHDAAGNAGLDVSDATFAIVAPVATPGPSAIADYGLELMAANPARGPIDVAYAVPVRVPVSIGVFDLAGRKVASLASGPHAAGEYRVRWEASSGRGSGIYFVRLSAPGRQLARKIVIAE